MSKLLIVESPSKAKTIGKYLGKEWNVIASVGHVRGLVKADGSIDPANNYAQKWQVLPGKEKNIRAILDAVKKADDVYLASDPDREGEGIAWHILDILNDKKALKGKGVYRVVFHEITKNSVNTAIANPREIDMNLVDAYLTRMSLDYLIGFGVSPLLFRRNLGRSAGRVQSIAVKLVVDREREITAFNPIEYWSLDAKCVKSGGLFNARLSNFNGEKIDKMGVENKAAMDLILSKLNAPTTANVIKVDKKQTTRKPTAPFITSTLQQEAARKLHFSSKRTMSAAQKLYENGFITYMRTDATNLSSDAVSEIRDYIMEKYGIKFLPTAPNIYITKSKNAQEAHEAIRPTNMFTPSALDGDEAKLYDLIWKRTIACQMTNALFDQVSVDLTPDNNAIFHAVGTTRIFDGFLKVYAEGKDDEEDDTESKLPEMNVGDKIDITEFIPEQHFTAPPPRFTEASLVKKLEELGIGRPSTYAGIMSTIVDRGYVSIDKSRRFTPTPSGWVVVSYLSKYFRDLMDVNFTAKTEDTLDDVSNGEVARLKALNDFWCPMDKIIDAARDVALPEIMNTISADMYDHLFGKCGDTCPECGGKLGVKLSKYGPFVGCSNYPKCKYTLRMTDNDTGGPAKEDDTNAGEDCPVPNPDLGDGITFKIGRFGPYVTDGVKNASARGYTAETITPEIAKQLLSADKTKAVAKELGINPETKKPILFYETGRYGSYISSNKVNVSVKTEPSLQDAIELINNKKKKK